ncbi:DUF523 domain-containing protein [Collinsella sp. An2]|uniref:DUF523 domain-containing protein n=1 Tax=Collinsella sp. An2 TaxID=1965585 RepID=UPI000B38AE06|nr:DUF523 domain-containing protein [Collinsella sp. An2]OUP10141.1 hypothetical protein B5F33_03565 [Collinsella sp. An2]
MRIAVSACLLGEHCKYSGGSNLCERLVQVLRAGGHEVVPVCPEVAGGLPVPRPCAEIRDGAVIDEHGSNVDEAFRQGAAVEWEKLEAQGGVDMAVTQPRSPSCGRDEVYDGTFTGRLIAGSGVFVQLLESHGVPVLSPTEAIERLEV